MATPTILTILGELLWAINCIEFTLSFGWGPSREARRNASPAQEKIKIGWEALKAATTKYAVLKFECGSSMKSIVH